MEIKNIEFNKLFLPDAYDRKKKLTRYDKENIKNLIEDIKKNGLTEPIVVMEYYGMDKYEILLGVRRCIALKILGEEIIPCSVLTYR